jgi:hypothetical protein
MKLSALRDAVANVVADSQLETINWARGKGTIDQALQEDSQLVSRITPSLVSSSAAKYSNVKNIPDSSGKRPSIKAATQDSERLQASVSETYVDSVITGLPLKPSTISYL